MKNTPWWRERWALAGALAAHALLLAVAERLPPRGDVGFGLVTEPAATEGDVVDVDVDGPSVSAAVDQGDTRSSLPGQGGVERAAETHTAAMTTSSNGAAEVAGEGHAAPVPAGPGTGGLPPPGAADEYGEPEAPTAGAVPLFGVPGLFGNLGELKGPAAPTQTERAPRVADDAAERAIASTLLSRDKRLGVSIPGAGVVQDAVSTAMRNAPVAHNTRATVRVELTPDGRVSSTKVVSSSGGDAATWDRMAKSVAASLGKQKLAMGAHGSRSGAVVTVTATQKHVFPTGTTKGADVKPVCANAVVNEIIAANDKDLNAPSAEGKVPLFVDENGLPCIPVGFAGVSDAANLGAQKQIQVQTSVAVTLAGELDLPEAVRTVDTTWVPLDKEAPRPNLPAKIRKRLRDKEKKK